MLHLFDLTITVHRSSDFRRLGLIATAFSCFVLCYSDAPIILVALLVSALLCSLWSMMKTSRPHPLLSTIGYHRGQWVLGYSDGSRGVYKSIRVCVNTGFFGVFRFEGERYSRVIVLFYDQLSREERRQIIILHEIV